MLSKQIAYEKWLGIKAPDQPPTLYRLLGVDAFEPDGDTISYAADSRMAFLRQFQIGDNAALAEEILNEVSNARVTLLNAEKKSAYDAPLRQRTTAQSAAAGLSSKSSISKVAKVAPLRRAEATVVPARPAQSAPTSPGVDLDSLISETRSSAPVSPGRQKKKIDPRIWIGAGSVVALVIATLVVLNLLSPHDDSPPANVPKTDVAISEPPKAPAKPAAPEVSTTPRPPDKPVAKPVAEPSRDIPKRPIPAPVATKTSTPSPPPIVLVPQESSPPDSEKLNLPPPADSPKPPVTVAPATTEPTLVAVPDASAQADAMKLVKEVYGSEWTAAKTADQKQELGKKLLEKAMESDRDRLAQFVLFRLSKEIASQASDCQTAFQAIDETGKVFQIDALEIKIEALKKCAASATTSDQQAAVSEKAAEVSDSAVANDNLTDAKAVADLAYVEAKKARDESLTKRSSDRKTEIEKIAKAYVTAKAAMAILETTPLDPEANLALGKYKCFFKGDWQGGLPKLALGNDPVLKKLAETEVKGAVSSDEQAKLGDAWWNSADAKKGVEKKQVQARAEFWYQQALPGLTGLAKDRTESRVQKLHEDLPVFLADLPDDEVRVARGSHTTFKGKPSPRTIWAHPPDDRSSSHRAFQLDRRFRTLHGDAGIANEPGKGKTTTPLIFRIVGDGVLLWQSVPLRESDVAIPFRVNVTKVTKLELFVDCHGTNESAWAIWVNPMLER